MSPPYYFFLLIFPATGNSRYPVFSSQFEEILPTIGSDKVTGMLHVDSIGTFFSNLAGDLSATRKPQARQLHAVPAMACTWCWQVVVGPYVDIQ